MKIEGSSFDSFQDFLLDYFAENQTEWEVYANSIALNFIKEYNKNFNFMLRKLKELNKKKISNISIDEVNKGRVISNIVVLRRMISINQEIADIRINFDAINKMFFKITDKGELDQVNKAIDDIDSEKNQKLGNFIYENKPMKSFQKLCAYHSGLISFVKEEQTRKDFYISYLNDKKISPNISPNLSFDSVLQ